MYTIQQIDVCIYFTIVYVFVYILYVQGVALSASISVLDRPVTGQGVMGMKTQGQGIGRLVEDNSYYVGLLRKKITEVSLETKKLKTEIDQQSKDNSAYNQLEKRYENLSKEKEKLEGQLADYNLAMDKVCVCMCSMTEMMYFFAYSCISFNTAYI